MSASKIEVGRKAPIFKLQDQDESTVIIDPEGRVAHHWKRVKSKGHAERVRERLEGLQS